MIKAVWNEKAAAALAAALGDGAADIAREVERGVSELWHYPPRTWLVTRLETHADGRELVLVALAGENGRAVERDFARIARKNGCKSIRVHSSRKGARRYLKPLGYVPVETVFKKVL